VASRDLASFQELLQKLPDVKKQVSGEMDAEDALAGE